jgi:hypothetical protein
MSGLNVIKKKVEVKVMVFIKTEHEGNLIILHCNKESKDGEYFKLVIDIDTKEIIEKPEKPDIDVSTAYSRVYNLLDSDKRVPDEMVACWG